MGIFMLGKMPKELQDLKKEYKLSVSAQMCTAKILIYC